MYKRLFYLLLALNLLFFIGLGFSFKKQLLNLAEIHMHRYEKTDTGLRYRYIKKGTGPIPKAGNKLLMSLVCKTKNGLVVLDTTREKQPMVIDFPSEDTKSLFPPLPTEAIQLMREGDQIMCKFTAIELLGDNFGYVGQMNNLKEDTLLFTQFNLQSVMDNEQYEKWAEEMKAKLVKERNEKIQKLRKEQEMQLEKDMEVIEQYIDQHKLKDKHTIKETSSGLRYILHKAGTGPSPSPGDEITVNYVGKDINDKVFDTSLEAVGKKNKLKREKYEPLTVPLGGLIPGFNEAVALLKKGGKMTVFIPSTLAYGKAGSGKHIPPNSVLIFDIDLLSFKKQPKEAKGHGHGHHQHNHKH